MLVFLCKGRFHLLPVQKLHFRLSSSSSSVSPKAPKTKSRNAVPLSFAANYLINKFGFSQERALVSSKQMGFQSPEKPDSVLAFLKKNGFSDAQITRIVTKSPAVLKLNPERNLLPKIDFFLSLGIPSDDVIKIITSCRSVLARSLDNQIAPAFNFVKDLLKSQEETIDTVKRYPNLLQVNLQCTVPPNIESLRKAGVPEDKIIHLFKNYPRFLMIPPDKFRICVEHIQGMGFNPSRTNFVAGLYVFRILTRSNWEKKMEVYKRWGYSESQVLAAFRNSPWCMALSEDKLERVMDHFINKMSCDHSFLLTRPSVVSLSLENTIIPRCSVYEILTSKGLIRKKTSLMDIFKHSKKAFLENFVLCFAEKYPELLELYPVRLDPPEREAIIGEHPNSRTLSYLVRLDPSK